MLEHNNIFACIIFFLSINGACGPRKEHRGNTDKWEREIEPRAPLQFPEKCFYPPDETLVTICMYLYKRINREKH